MNETAKPRISLMLSLFLALLSGACGGPAEEPPLHGAKIGGAWTLVDHDARPVSDRDFAGKYRIVYFGFATCPDICPTDLAKIGQAMRILEKEEPKLAQKVQPLFITTDPERDTPKVLKEYVGAFHPRITGLTGTPEQIAAAAKGHAIFYSKVPTETGYTMEHQRIVYLLGPQGEPIAMLPHEQGAEAIAAEIERWAA